jgi:cell division septum initiation protein DivIVA
MASRKDPTIDVLRLLENLKEVAQKPKCFMGVAFGYDAEEMVMQIEKIRATLPREVKDAASLSRESERIIEGAKEDSDQLLRQAQAQAARALEEAKAEADRLIEQGRLQQQQMVVESEILKLAKAQADEVRQAAERESSQMRRGADRYAHEVLSNLEASVGKVLTQVERGRAELDNVLKDSSATPVREKVKAL